MKKLVFLVLLVLVLAVAMQLPDTGITGFFVKVAVTGLALAKEILKTILTFIVNRL